MKRRATRALAVALLTAALGPAPAAGARQKDTVAEGRYHLRKANALAGNDHCDAAIREFTLAYEKLHDPVVLFNRAECRRRIGQADDAVADYRAFLAAVPKTPNRAEIEAKIAALEVVPPPLGHAPAGAPRARAPAPVAPRPPTATPADETAAALAVSPPAAPQPAAAPATAPVLAAPVAAETANAPDRRWLWTAVGVAVAVAGGAAGAYFALRTPGATPPATELGNYKF